MTLYALPVTSFEGLSSVIFDHFGRCEVFAVIEVGTARIDSVSVVHNPPSYGSIGANLPDFLAEHGIDVVLAGEIGPCMSTPLIDRGIRVFKGACGTVKSAYEKYQAGELEEVQKSRYSL